MPQFIVRSVEDVTVDEKITAMGDKELRLIGYRTPKRKLKQSRDDYNSKRSPFY